MCGIIGTFLPEPLPAEAFRAALDRLSHRGPDDSGVAGSGGCRVGVRRLAIIDLESGRQPMSSPDGGVSVVQNGEIYNYVELRRDLRARGRSFQTESDTEVLLEAYLERGEGFVDELRGMFALAVLDRRKERLVLARDRFGKKPLFYHQPPSGGLLFASELKALLALMEMIGRAPEIRPQAIYDYLSLGVVPQPETIYRGVRMLEPGHVLRFDKSGLERRRYWSLEFMPKRRTPAAEARREVRRLVGEAVEIRLRSDVPLGILLSGGVDSAVIAHEAAHRSATPPRLFTVGVDDPALDETALARTTAARLGLETTVLRLTYSPLEHLETVVGHYDQPFGDPSAIPSLAVSRLARREVKVVLNGDGGDEIFAGYRRYLAGAYAPALAWLPGTVTRGLAALLDRASTSRRSGPGFAARFLRGLDRSPGARYLCWTTDLCNERDKSQLWRGAACVATEDKLDELMRAELTGLDHQLAADHNVNLLSDLLVKMDMATMAHSLEARSPLLDHKLAEYVARLPSGLKVSGATTKRLLRDAYRDALPPEVIRGAKRGFEVPLARWIGHELREVIGDTLASSNARVAGFVEPDTLAAILGGTALGRRNRPHLVYALLVLELWLRQREANA